MTTPRRTFEVAILKVDGRDQDRALLYEVKNHMNREHNLPGYSPEYFRFIVVPHLTLPVTYLMYETVDLDEAARFASIATEEFNRLYRAAQAQRKAAEEKRA